MKKQVVLLLSVFVVSNLALSTLIISLSNRAQRQRATNSSIVEQLRQVARQGSIDSKTTVCILLIDPNARNDENKADCRTKAIKEVDEG